jgi:hypothetical protein
MRSFHGRFARPRLAGLAFRSRSLRAFRLSSSQGVALSIYPGGFASRRRANPKPFFSDELSFLARELGSIRVGRLGSPRSSSRIREAWSKAPRCEF